MKKIVCVLGSPRKGANSETIARKVAETAESLGAQTETFRLYDLAYKGCLGCMACKSRAEECVVADELQPVLRAVWDADILIVASPIYAGQITGETKSFIDRMFSFLVPNFHSIPKPSRLVAGKKCLFVLTQGAEAQDVFAGVFPGYAQFFGPDFLGYKMHLLRGLGLGAPTDAAANADLMHQAEEMGRTLMA